MGKILILAAYAVYAAFWIRFFMHGLVWWRAFHRLDTVEMPHSSPRAKAWGFAVLDVVFLARLLRVNPALWLGEWVFHASFLLVLARHLRFFLNPVPAWVWWVQTPGLIAGYVLPLALVYILIVRLLTKHEKYASRANMILLGLVLAISSLGVLMQLALKPNLVDVKLFIYGLTIFSPAPAPESIVFLIHFILVLVLILFLPSHIFTAPFVMFEARKREQGLHAVIHEDWESSECELRKPVPCVNECGSTSAGYADCEIKQSR